MIVGNGDFINLSGDESKGLMIQNMLSESVISDVYKSANVPEGTYISGVEFDESTNTFTFTFSNGTKFIAEVKSEEVDLSGYVSKPEMDEAIKDFQTAGQVDERINAIIGSAPEALDTLQELSASLGDDPNFATTVTTMVTEVRTGLESKANKDEIPNIEGLASSTEVESKVAEAKSYTDAEVAKVKGEIPDLDGYVTEESLESKGYLTEHQDISGLALKSDVYTKTEADSKFLTEHQDISNLAVKAEVYTKTEADNKFLTEHQDISGLATKEELSAVEGSIPSIDGLAQTSYVDTQKTQAIESSNSYTDEKINEVKALIPSTEGLATESWVEGKGYLTEHQDISGLAVKAEVYTKTEADAKFLTEHQSLADYATEEYVTEAVANNAAMKMLVDRLNVVEDQVSNLKKTDIEVVAAEEGTAVTVADPTKDAVVSGSIDTTSTISAKSVTLNNVSVANNARLKITTTDKSGDVELKSVNVSGDFPKTNGNTIVSVNDAGYVVIKDAVINATTYNCIEIGLSGELPSGVLIENCKFMGKFSNNAILIFGTKENAVININNCYFEDVSNVLRFSNKSNTHCTANITNCKCDKWDTAPQWAGMILCQDYTSKTADACNANNLFGDGKITINISNLTKPDGTKLVAPSDMSTILGSGDTNQILYVWNQPTGSIPYGDGSKYPTVNIL